MDILVAHRDAGTRSRLRTLLEADEHVVGEVAEHDAVLPACREHDPDVLLLEASEDGDVALRAIKSDPEVFAIAVILVGDESRLGDPASSLERGAHDVLLTPLRDGEVVGRCRAAVKVRHLQEAVLDLDRTLEELAYIDALTRLYNRRFIFTQLNALTSSALRHNRALSVIAIDIDRFKTINDTFGHAAGDEALQAVAARILRRLRTEDFAARIGGEEFLVVLPDTDGEDAAHVAEDLRHSVGEKSFSLNGGDLDVTVSLGWAELDPRRPDDLIKQADEALYRAKREGRNRVCGPVDAPDTALEATRPPERVVPLPPGPRRGGRGRRARR